MAVKKMDDPAAVTAPEKTAEEVLAEAKAQAAELLAEARAQAEALLSAARSQAEASPVGGPVPAAPEKMVRIRLQKDNWRYRDDVFVGVNGKGWLIKRGVPVEVPENVAEVLENSIRQDESTAMLIERESSKYENDPMTK
nr:MAG TPA: V-type ATP synthase subunit E [Caudoviricetes sp.]